MAYTIAWARVADVDRFLETFKTRGKEKRSQSGSRGSRAFRSLEEENRVIVVFDWDQDDFEAFRADPEAQEIMQAAGIEDLKVTFGEQIAELPA